MPFDELIETLKRQYETETGWGDSNGWTNQDFINLSERIHERTGVLLSHVTLKRIWGKVKYDSLPNTYTLDTLAHYIGFESWRSFVTAHNKNAVNVLVHEPIAPEPEAKPRKPVNKQLRTVWIMAVVLLLTILGTYFSVKKSPAPVTNNDYKFSSRKVVTSGLPNSVIFNYDATKAPEDSVIIQQSWNPKLRTKVSKRDHQHTSIYYYPDYYKAKLIVNNKIVKQHELFIKSDGWLAVIEQDPVPVYINKDDINQDGRMGISAETILKHNIKLQPVPPNTLFSNVRDFGEIYSDDFVFETSFKNDYREGSAICQKTDLFLLCKGTAIGIPLSARGCISALNMYFTNYFRSGKTEDLSNFGVDFNKFVKLRIESHNKKARIYIDDKLVYTVDKDIIHSRIIGIDFRFQGAGLVDYVKLSNGKVNFEDNF
ncbi:hypothetical protein [Mucilaginibacter sp.]|jgi:hypothetical protein|uniref:hypothetical protein n=1 Tax=Mucilaginibacter sp. TaxID=1882438 RepID=UPI003561FA7E